MNACTKSCCRELESCGGCCDPTAVDNWPDGWRALLWTGMTKQLLWPEEAAVDQRHLEFAAYLWMTGGYAQDGGPAGEQIVLLSAVS